MISLGQGRDMHYWRGPLKNMGAGAVVYEEVYFALDLPILKRIYCDNDTCHFGNVNRIQ